MTPTFRAVSCALALALAALQPATAQGLREVRDRGAWGLGFLVGVPVGQFGEMVDEHPGIGAALTLGGPVGLRLGGSVLVYGHRREFYQLSGYGGRLFIDGDVDNLIATMGIGPQITIGGGPLRLYGYGTLGFSYFATVTSFGSCGRCGGGDVTHFDDWALAREVGAGLELRLARRRPIYLDLSARYLRNGRVRYLTEGSLYEALDGSLGLQPIETHANLLAFQIGISVALR